MSTMGIIPARAGFTRHRRYPAPSLTDHPRSRGVYGQARPHRGAGRGSSPLARGLRVVVRPGDHAAGIIPARAGFTNTYFFRE